jgi:hypothetical protein
MWDVTWTGKVHARFSLGDVKERHHFVDLGVDGKIILRWIFKRCDGDAWTGLIWLSIGTDGGSL